MITNFALGIFNFCETPCCVLNGSTCLERSQVHWHHSIQATSSHLTSTTKISQEDLFSSSSKFVVIWFNTRLSIIDTYYHNSTLMRDTEDVFFHEWGFLFLDHYTSNMIWNVYLKHYKYLSVSSMSQYIQFWKLYHPLYCYGDDESQNKSVNYIPNQIKMWEIHL